MKTFTVLLAIFAVASAASIMTMDDREFEQMMENLSRGKMAPLMDIHAFMDGQDEEPQAVEADGELSDAEEPADDEADDDHRPIITDAAPYTAKQPSRKPTANNNNRKPAQGNGKRGGGSAAVASATSFSRGPNSSASSSAQAFSRGSK